MHHIVEHGRPLARLELVGAREGGRVDRAKVEIHRARDRSGLHYKTDHQLRRQGAPATERLSSLVKAQSGPRLAFRSSFRQTCRRRSVVVSTFNRAQDKIPASVANRSLDLPSGSPRIDRLLPPCTITPGSTASLAECITAPRALCGPTTLHSSPPGSRSGRLPRAPSNPCHHHQGMPLVTKRMAAPSFSRAEAPRRVR